MVSKINKDNKMYKVRNNIFYPFFKEDYERSLNSVVESGFNKELIFLKLTFTHNNEIVQRSHRSDNEYVTRDFFSFSKESFINYVESALLGINFLNFVYGRYIENKNKIGGKLVILLSFHSILGYDSSILPSFTYSKVEYLDSISKIKRCIKFINKGYNYENIYFHSYNLKLYGIKNSIIFDIFKYSKFQPNIFKKLMYFSKFTKDESIYGYKDPGMFSVRKKSHLSIINMWNVYMLRNNLYYSQEDNKIYKKINIHDISKERDEYEYFSELDYLYKNIMKIWYYIYYYFREYKDFPINRVITDHFEEAIKIISNPASASILLPIINYWSIVIEQSEKSEEDCAVNYERHNEILKSYKDCLNSEKQEFEEYLEDDLYKEMERELFLTEKELRRKILMDIHNSGNYYNDGE